MAARLFCIFFALVGIPLNLVVLNRLGHLMQRGVHRCAYRLGARWQVREWLGTRMSLQDQEGWNGENEGIGRIGGTESKMGSSIVKMSIIEMRSMAGIKATVDSWQEMWGIHKDGEVGIGHLLLDPPVRDTGQRCAAGLCVGTVANRLRCAALRPPALPLVASSSLLPHGGLELRGELLLRLHHSQHRGIR